MSVSNKRRIVTAVVTVVIAIGAGHLMQYGLAGVERFQQPAPRPTGLRPERPKTNASTILMPSPLIPVPPTSGDARSGDAAGVPEPPDATLRPIDLRHDAIAPVSVPLDVSIVPPSDEQVNLDGFGLDCEVVAEARSVPAALLQVDLHATCDPDALVRVSHNGLEFTSNTDSAGTLSITLPALETRANVVLEVGRQDPITVSAEVSEADWYDRVVLMWDGTNAMSVHAFELGAGPGSAGHVSARHPQTPAHAAAAEGGFLLRLGEPGQKDARMAEVYSFPSGRMPQAGVVRLSVAAEVTPQTCDRNVPVRILQTKRGGTLRNDAVSVAFPGCGAVGQILVLKNLLQDLKIAQN